MARPNLLTLCDATAVDWAERQDETEAWLAEHGVLATAFEQLAGYDRALSRIENEYLEAYGPTGCERMLSDRRWQRLVRLTGDLATAYWRSVGSDPN